jgi:hypothetical protein
MMITLKTNVGTLTLTSNQFDDYLALGRINIPILVRGRLEELELKKQHLEIEMRMANSKFMKEKKKYYVNQIVSLLELNRKVLKAIAKK